MKSFSKGFTLIELLVVIAIIGILSSVVLASLNSARQKGADAAIKSDLSGARAQAEIYRDGTAGQDYGTHALANCFATATGNVFADTTVKNAIQHALDQSGGTAGNAICVADATAKAYAVSVKLRSDSAKSWCVDSTGVAKSITGVLASGTACP